MKNKHIFVIDLLFIAVFLVVILIGVSLVSAMTSSNYITDVLLSGGGGNITSSNYNLRSMLDIISGIISSGNYINYVGFYEGASTELIVPLIDFGFGSENNNEVGSNGKIYVNVSVTEENEATITFSLFNSSGEVNSTMYTSPIRTINWTGLADGNYTYNVTVNDTSFNKNSTSTYSIKLVSSCLDLTSCNESSTNAFNCDIIQDCWLHSGLCSESVCDFANFTINSTLYTLYDSSNNGNDFVLNLSGIIGFTAGNSIVFSGKNGTTVTGGSLGGNAGVFNVTVYGLFNTTSAVLNGSGGYSTLGGVTGGDGGILQLNYWGLIRNFSDSKLGIFPAPADNTPVLTAGNSTDGTSGTNTAIIYNQFNTTYQQTELDVDLTGDGTVDADDYALIVNNYNNVTGDSGFSASYDVNNDGKLNVIDLSRIGMDWGRGI